MDLHLPAGRDRSTPAIQGVRLTPTGGPAVLEAAGRLTISEAGSARVNPVGRGASPLLLLERVGATSSQAGWRLGDGRRMIARRRAG